MKFGCSRENERERIEMVRTCREKKPRRRGREFRRYNGSGKSGWAEGKMDPGYWRRREGVRRKWEYALGCDGMAGKNTIGRCHACGTEAKIEEKDLIYSRGMRIITRT